MPSRVICGRLQKESGLGVESFCFANKRQNNDNQGGKSRQQMLTNYLQLPHTMLVCSRSGMILPDHCRRTYIITYL